MGNIPALKPNEVIAILRKLRIYRSPPTWIAQTIPRCGRPLHIVSPAARGRGVGRYLIEQMIGLAFSRHQAAEVTVSCFNQNVAGLLLYPKMGFQPYAVEERQDKKGSRVALIHMRLARNAS